MIVVKILYQCRRKITYRRNVANRIIAIAAIEHLARIPTDANLYLRQALHRAVVAPRLNRAIAKIPLLRLIERRFEGWRPTVGG